MNISKSGNYSDPEQHPITTSPDLNDKLKSRLKFVVLKFLQDNPDLNPDHANGNISNEYSADTYLTESSKIINTKKDILNLLLEHYQIIRTFKK